MDAKAIAQTTVAALEHGQYIAPDGNAVDLSGLLATCLSGTQSYDPDELARLREQVLAQPTSQQPTTFAVVNETTLQGCTRLMANQQYQRIGVLNASLSSRTLEVAFYAEREHKRESLARSSALSFSLRRCPEHSAFHRARGHLPPL